jgi:hypothetical protein
LAQRRKPIASRLAYPAFWKPKSENRNARQYELTDLGVERNHGRQITISRRQWLEYVRNQPRARQTPTLEQLSKMRAEKGLPRGVGRGRRKSAETEIARHIHFLPSTYHMELRGTAVYEFKTKAELDRALRWMRKNFKWHSYRIKVQADTIHFYWSQSPLPGEDPLFQRDVRILPYSDATLTQQSKPNPHPSRMRSLKTMMEMVESDDVDHTVFYIKKIRRWYLYVDLTPVGEGAREGTLTWNSNHGFLGPE